MSSNMSEKRIELMNGSVIRVIPSEMFIPLSFADLLRSFPGTFTSAYAVEQAAAYGIECPENMSRWLVEHGYYRSKNRWRYRKRVGMSSK